MHVRRWRHQPAPALGLHNRPFGRAVCQTHRTHRIGAGVGINLDTMQGVQGHIHGVDIEFTTGKITHPAFGAPLVVNLEGRHRSLLSRSPAGEPPAPRPPPPGRGPDHSAPARTCHSPVWRPHTPSDTTQPQTVYSRTPRQCVFPY